MKKGEIEIIGPINIDQKGPEAAIVTFTIRGTFWSKFRNLFFKDCHYTFNFTHIEINGEWKK